MCDEPDLREFVTECGACGRPLREDEACDCHLHAGEVAHEEFWARAAATGGTWL